MSENKQWLKQTDKPLFEDLLWSRPQNRQQAGKLLIIGGNLHGFSAPGAAFTAASEAGAGSIRILLPDSVKKAVGKLIPDADYAPSTPSGSFARKALAEMLSASQWADMVLMAGDFGRSSETAITLDGFINKYQGKLAITGDSLDYFYKSSGTVLDREQTLVTASMMQLQKLITGYGSGLALKIGADLLNVIDVVGKFSASLPSTLITEHSGSYIVAGEGKISTTRHDKPLPAWQQAVTAKTAVLWAQNPAKIFESASSGVWINLKEDR